MTAKRFELCEINCFDYGVEVFNEIMDKGVPLSQKQVCELLNELAEENEQLKEDNKILNRINDKVNGWNGLAHDKIFKLEKENEQLKKDIEYYKIERLALFEYLDKKDDLKLELKVEK